MPRKTFQAGGYKNLETLRQQHCDPPPKGTSMTRHHGGNADVIDCAICSSKKSLSSSTQGNGKILNEHWINETDSLNRIHQIYVPCRIIWEDFIQIMFCLSVNRGSSGGRVVKLLACRARGPGFDSRPRHLNFQRLVISCFQVAIWLKYHWSDVNPQYNQPICEQATK